MNGTPGNIPGWDGEDSLGGWHNQRGEWSALEIPQIQNQKLVSQAIRNQSDGAPAA
jgi:hypothetical protein